ncbi:hypothetical protein R5R35_006653 [Gryllus longicercus]|uniref:Centaurin-gamma-1A n=1 Tax=Gryllus longicercus TaxID=2509291 RepID=A0AAN9V9M4_9ORTH
MAARPHLAPFLSNSVAIRQEIQRFESVHPSIYAIYDLIELVPDALVAQQIRDHVVCIEGRQPAAGVHDSGARRVAQPRGHPGARALGRAQLAARCHGDATPPTRPPTRRRGRAPGWAQRVLCAERLCRETFLE